MNIFTRVLFRSELKEQQQLKKEIRELRSQLQKLQEQKEELDLRVRVLRCEKINLQARTQREE